MPLSLAHAVPTRGEGESDPLDGIEEMTFCSKGRDFCQRLVLCEVAGRPTVELDDVDIVVAGLSRE